MLYIEGGGGGGIMISQVVRSGIAPLPPTQKKRLRITDLDVLNHS